MVKVTFKDFLFKLRMNLINGVIFLQQRQSINSDCRRHSFFQCCEGFCNFNVKALKIWFIIHVYFYLLSLMYNLDCNVHCTIVHTVLDGRNSMSWIHCQELRSLSFSLHWVHRYIGVVNTSTFGSHLGFSKISMKGSHLRFNKISMNGMPS